MSHHKIDYKPKIIWTPNIKSKEQLFEEYIKENYGKAYDAWNETL